MTWSQYTVNIMDADEWVTQGAMTWIYFSWWRHQTETISALLALCAGISPVTGEFPSQRAVTRSFGVFFDLAWTNGWVNNREASILRRHRAHYDVIVMSPNILTHLPLDKIVAVFAYDNFRCIFLNESDKIPIRISLKFVPRRPIDSKAALVQVMALALGGDERSWSTSGVNYPSSSKVYRQNTH